MQQIHPVIDTLDHQSEMDQECITEFQERASSYCMSLYEP